MHKVFISYHHENDQGYKERLVNFGEQHGIFIDQSVDTGNISDSLSDESIREKIRDEYLRDSTSRRRKFRSCPGRGSTRRRSSSWLMQPLRIAAAASTT